MDIKSKQFKYLVFSIVFLAVLIFLGRNLNPFNDVMFTGHDETQSARITQFTLNVQNGHIPPRIAPDFSLGLGYPIFNYYAPFSYWITSGLNLIGFDTISALKFSYAFALSLGFIGMFLFLKRFYSFYPSILGASAYVSSPYIATEIFVRANLAEMWFFALFPLTLYFLLSNTKRTFIFTAVILSFLFTAHNILSLLSVPLILIFIWFTKNRMYNFIAFGLSLLLSAYFFVPFFGELSMVHATQVARITDYKNHFLCLSQVWASQWGYGGSTAGCVEDGMSFMLGKTHLLLGIIGISLFIYSCIKGLVASNVKRYYIFFFVITLLSLLFTLNFTPFIWDIVSPVASFIQFPWRLLLFTVFGLSFFIAFAAERIPSKYIITSTIMAFLLIGYNSKFFYGQNISKNEFQNKFLSQEYIRNSVAYKVAEYLPISADYEYWRSLENKKIDTSSVVVQEKKVNQLDIQNKPFTKIVMIKAPENAAINIHYAPYWKITQNIESVVPERFDKLGRPIIKVSNESYDSIVVQYEQTAVEKFANAISLITILIMLGYGIKNYIPSWKNMPISIKKI